MANNEASIKISAVDQTSVAFKSIIKNLEQTNSKISSVGSALDGLKGIAGTLGVTLSAASFASFIKANIDAQDALFKMSQRTGYAVEALSGLKKGADLSDISVEQLEKTLVKLNSIAFSASSGDKGIIQSLKTLRINIDEFTRSDPEERIYLVARALEQFGDADKSVALTQLLGDKMAYLTPLLGQGEKYLRDLTAASRENGLVTTESAKAAEMFNDNLTLLKKEVNSLGIEFGNILVPQLNIAITRFNEARKSAGLLAGVFAGFKGGFAETPLDLSNPSNSLEENKKEYARQINEIDRLRQEYIATQKSNPITSEIIGTQSEQTLSAIKQEIKQRQERIEVLKKENAVFASAILNEKEAAVTQQKQLSANAEADRLKRIEDERAAREQAAKESLASQKRIQEAQDKWLESLDDELARIQLSEVEYKKLQAIKQGLKGLDLERANEQIGLIAAQKQKTKEEEDSLKRINELKNKAKQYVEGSKNDQQKFNDTLKELNNLYDKNYLSIEDYRQSVNKLSVDYDEASRNANKSFKQQEEYAKQAARNIQSSFADALFNIFTGNGGNAFDQIKNTLLRNFSESLSRDILSLNVDGKSSGKEFGTEIKKAFSSEDGIISAFTKGFTGTFGVLFQGLTSIFSTTKLLSGSGEKGIFSAISDSIGSIFSSGSNGGLFSSISNGFKGIGSSLSSLLPSTISSSLSGIGSTITGSLGGIGASLTGAMAGLSAAAGPIAGLMAATGIFRSFAGDKKLGGGFGKALNKIGDIPIVGDMMPFIPLLNSLFGRGPYKLKQRNFQGNIGADSNVESWMWDSFKSKGGLFLSNKWKATQTNSDPVVEKEFSDQIKLFKNGIAEVGDVLGINTEAAKKFSTYFDIKIDFNDQEKAKQQIEDLFKSFGDSMTRLVMPSINDLAMKGESLYDAFIRVGKNFAAVIDASVIFGFSLNEARNNFLRWGHAGTQAIIDLFGGVEKFQEMSSFFENEFLDGSARKQRDIEQLNESLSKLGINTNISRKEFTALVESFGHDGGIMKETLVELLKLAPLFDKVHDSIGDTVNTLEDSASRLEDAKSKLQEAYQKQLDELTNTRDAFKDIIKNLQQFKQSLTQGSLSPLTPSQKLDESRLALNRTLLAARGGDQDAIANFSKVAEEFLQASQVYNASGAAYQSDFALVLRLNDEMQNLAKNQVDKAEESLKALKDSVSHLIDINDSVMSVSDAINNLADAMRSGTGNSSITDQQIRDIANDPKMTLKQKFDWAAKNGLSDAQIINAIGDGANQQWLDQKKAEAGIVTDAQIREYAKNTGNNLKALYDFAIANGIDRFKLSRVLGWKVKDIESWVKENNLAMFKRGSDLIPKDGLAMLHQGEAVVPSSAVELISQLIKEVQELRKEQRTQVSDQIKSTVVSNINNAESIINSYQQISKSCQMSYKVAGIRS